MPRTDMADWSTAGATQCPFRMLCENAGWLVTAAGKDAGDRVNSQPADRGFLDDQPEWIPIRIHMVWENVAGKKSGSGCGGGIWHDHIDTAGLDPIQVIPQSLLANHDRIASLAQVVDCLLYTSDAADE